MSEKSNAGVRVDSGQIGEAIDAIAKLSSGFDSGKDQFIKAMQALTAPDVLSGTYKGKDIATTLAELNDNCSKVLDENTMKMAQLVSGFKAMVEAMGMSAARLDSAVESSQAVIEKKKQETKEAHT